MSGSTRFLAALCCVALISSCGSNDPVPQPAGGIDVKASQPDVKADGNNVVTITVSRETSAAVTLTTARGTWKDTGTNTTELPSGNGTAVLVTCDSRGLGACAGLNKIEAKSADGLTGVFNGLAFLQVELCSNGKDDNGDGKSDCADVDCSNTKCTLTDGLVGDGHCDNEKAACVCNSGTTEVCTDGVDNNCNTKADCADDACGGKVCRLPSGNNGVCTAGACVCAATTEDATTCSDGQDNDCDGVADCADPDCYPTTIGANDGKVCELPNGGRQKQCDATGQCICVNGQAQETSCADGVDNDCDGKVDCSDTDCAGDQCTATGKTCAGTVCACPTGQTSETTCNDFEDNDCDGVVDCADPDCNLKVCPGGASYTCKAGVCSDDTGTWAVTVVPGSSRIPADGTASTQVTVTLTNNGARQSNRSVSLTLVNPTGGAPSGTISPASGTTDSNGELKVTFTSGAAGGDTRIVATYQVSVASSVTGQAVIDQPKLGELAFVSQQFSVMGVRESSFQEANDIVFGLKDVDGAPYPAGLKVKFTHTSVGGSFIGATASCTGIPLSCTAQATTNSEGFVTVTLHSGTVASVVSIVAEATAGAISKSSTATKLAIVGARASGSRISLFCTPRNLPGLTDHNCSVSHYAGKTITCRASFGDRFSNVLGVSTLATLTVEAGAAGQPTFTPAYNPTGASDPNLGYATNYINVAGYPLPQDVPPQAGEFSLAYDSGCGAGKVHNPRDGIVSIIVSASGEEGFVDGSNGRPADGVYNPPQPPLLGENFIDIAEPFVDSNDNGVRDNSEPYVDSNNNQMWDGPNGVWDPLTVIWSETRVLYTGHTQVRSDGAGNNLFSRWFDVGSGPPPTPTPQPTFAVTMARTGPPATPATSQQFGVYFTDENFNRLAPETTYAVRPSPLGENVSFIQDPKDGTDNLGGLTFTQQFCATPELASATCFNSCESAPCYAVSRVTNTNSGRVGYVTITAGTNPGSGVVQVESTLLGVSTALGIAGTVFP